jgi:hypothetical protein
LIGWPGLVRICGRGGTSATKGLSSLRQTGRGRRITAPVFRNSYCSHHMLRILPCDEIPNDYAGKNGCQEQWGRWMKIAPNRLKWNLVVRTRDTREVWGLLELVMRPMRVIWRFRGEPRLHWRITPGGSAWWQGVPRCFLTVIGTLAKTWCKGPYLNVSCDESRHTKFPFSSVILSSGGLWLICLKLPLIFP